MGKNMEHSVTVDVNKVAKGEHGAVVHTRKAKPVDKHYTIVKIVEMNRTFQGRTLGKIGDFLRSMYRSDHPEQASFNFVGEISCWHGTRWNRGFVVGGEGKKYQKGVRIQNRRQESAWMGRHSWIRAAARMQGSRYFRRIEWCRGWPDAWRPSSLYGQLQGSNDLVNQRLIGEIHLDGFEVSHTKDNILWRGNQEDEVEEKLKETLQRLPGLCEAQAQG